MEDVNKLVTPFCTSVRVESSILSTAEDGVLILFLLEFLGSQFRPRFRRRI